MVKTTFNLVVRCWDTAQLSIVILVMDTASSTDNACLNASVWTPEHVRSVLYSVATTWTVASESVVGVGAPVGGMVGASVGARDGTAVGALVGGVGALVGAAVGASVGGVGACEGAWLGASLGANDGE